MERKERGRKEEIEREREVDFSLHPCSHWLTLVMCPEEGPNSQPRVSGQLSNQLNYLRRAFFFNV